jgi:hypothetical protein
VDDLAVRLLAEGAGVDRIGIDVGDGADQRGHAALNEPVGGEEQ